MKYYVLTVEKDGTLIPLDAVQAKRKAVKEKILNEGKQYIETEAQIGSLDALAQRIEHKVYVIEPIWKDIYV